MLYIFCIVLGISDFILWSLRKNPKDIVAMYDALSPLMCGLANSTMLNFGYWDDIHDTPLLAQKNMCNVISNMAGFDDLNQPDYVVLDVGCGLCSPAAYWKSIYTKMNIHCINISYEQLHDAMLANCNDIAIRDVNCNNSVTNLPANLINASAIMLPFASNSVNCIVALESAQHFNPFENFIAESKRLLIDNDGVLIIAIPVVMHKPLIFAHLGILNFTWASEHYTLAYIHQKIRDGGFQICDQHLVGKQVYGPLANYYTTNRKDIKSSIKKMDYPAYLESVIMSSMKKMKKASDAGVIDYAIIKCKI